MENNWTLHVQELGKIESADITVAPMTLFVGDNNSGKSYLMAVLYSLMNIRIYADRYNLCKASSEFKECENWIKEQFEHCQGTPVTVKFTSDIRRPFEVLLNKVLDQNLNRIARQTFNSRMSIGKIAITFPIIKNQELKFDKQVSNVDDATFYTITPLINTQKSYTRARSYRPDDSTFFVGFILEYLIKAEFRRFAQGNVGFLPTSRTGFLLTYRSLVQASISDTYDVVDGQQAVNQQLTRPCSDFLKNLAALSEETRTNKCRSIIEFIEEKMVCGHVSLEGSMPQSTIYYHPNATNLDIPMHLASGVVTELAPLLLLLKYYRNMQVLFMEEPEIGLHPALQLNMARVFVQLCSGGTPVFITTHSDTILQHFNNMIKLSRAPEQIQHVLLSHTGYGKEDILRSEDVAMYQFDVSSESGKSTVQKLVCTEYGFVVPTFNDALSALLKQTRDFEIDSYEV